jgi:hypothetical protein
LGGRLFEGVGPRRPAVPALHAAVKFRTIIRHLHGDLVKDRFYGCAYTDPTGRARPPPPECQKHRPDLSHVREPHWIISLTKWDAESSGKWWYAGDTDGSRGLASIPQNAYRFDTRVAAESMAQTFRDTGDRDVEVLESTS